MMHLAQQLPSDVLQEIFAEAISNESEALNIRASILISCSQVCNQWRNAALGNTRLWTQIIDFNHTSTIWIDELLKRSDPHGIDFGSGRKAVLAENIDSNKISLLLSHASRIRTFHLDPPQNHTHTEDDLVHTVAKNLIRRLFELPLPSLNCLYVKFYEVPQIVGNATQLRTLRITSTSGCLRTLLSNILLPSLEELAVWEAGGHPNVPEWVGILSTRTPNLKQLHLRYAAEESDGSTMHTNSETGDLLPKLEEISIHDSYIAVCIDFINALRPPSTCDIEIEGFFWEEDDVHLLSSFIRRRVQTWPSETPNRFLEISYEIERDYEYEAEITISNRFETSDKQLLPVTQNLKIPTKRDSIARLDPDLLINAATIPGFSGMMFEHVTSILNILWQMERTFATTTTLRIRQLLDPSGPDIDELDSELQSFWNGLFARLSSIEVLMLSGDALCRMIPILMQNSPAPNPLFPCLESLVLEIYEPVADEAVQGLYFSITQAFLLQRKEQGFPIQTVYLLVSDANNDMINRIFDDLCHLVVIDFPTGAT